MDNRLNEIQEMLIKEMNRLDSNGTEDIIAEVSRSNALSQSALTFIKSINTQIRVREIADKQQKSINLVEKELGIKYEK